ncbi:hypothetical protein H0H93_004403 [Arthromyces matolae]|nr:hypothetical protein H0H93_004403 [Arthromyces matolae]
MAARYKNNRETLIIFSFPLPTTIPVNRVLRWMTMSSPRPTPPAPPSTPVYEPRSILFRSRPYRPYPSPPTSESSQRMSSSPPAPPSTPVYELRSLSPPSQPYPSYASPSSPTLPRTPRVSYAPLPPYTPSPSSSPPRPSSNVYPSRPSTSAINLTAQGSQLPTTRVSLHPLLRYSQHSNNGPPLIWDLRTEPDLAALALLEDADAGTKVPISEFELYQPATAPPTRVIRLLCGIAPPSSRWNTITVVPASRTAPYITVHDVLSVVRRCMSEALTYDEWDALGEVQRVRVSNVFEARWHISETPEATKDLGVLRQDCLLMHTHWGGLTMSFEDDGVATLTLRRDSPRPASWMITDDVDAPLPSDERPESSWT